jgi:hypothetical protein
MLENEAARAARLASLKADLANMEKYTGQESHPDDAVRMEKLREQIAELKGE